MPSGDFFSAGVAPLRSPFAAYTGGNTLSQQRSQYPNWGNVGHQSSMGPFGQDQGDISQAGWRNPLDLFTQQAEREMAKYAQMQGPSVPGQNAPMGSPQGAKWANVNRWDSAVQAAAQKYGVDPNRLKAHMMIESGGNPGAVQPNTTNGYTYGLMQINSGIWGPTLAANGIDMNTPEGNIMGAAYILADNYKRYGSWDAASSAFFTGQPGWQGADTHNGTTGGQYRDTLNGYMAELGASGGGMPSGGGNASSVVQAATSFVGRVPYGWGGIPAKGQDPLTYQGPSGPGWDCSGFTFWLDQNYGNGTLERGSHFQYAQGLREGRINTNPSQLQAGDLVFFDTGLRGGGGANLNNASHVGMYIGNGQFVHAANPNDGTIISDLNQYISMYGFLGGMKMSWSGGGAYNAPIGGGTQSYGYGSGTLFGSWQSLMDPNAAWRSYKR